MSDDYVYPERRKTKKSDRRAKARFMRYKRGGAQRVTGITMTGTGGKKEERKN